MTEVLYTRSSATFTNCNILWLSKFKLLNSQNTTERIFSHMTAKRAGHAHCRLYFRRHPPMRTGLCMQTCTTSTFRKIGRLAFLRPPLGDLGATYDDYLRLIGKRVVDFLLALIELFFARCYS